MHAHQFWWVWSLRFQRYCYLSKTAKFPFWGMDYSPWSSKNLIDQNQLKKNHASRDRYQVHAHQFWWAWSLQFQRYCYLSKMAKFPFRGMDYSPWSSKNLIDRNRLKKIMQVGINIKCMHTSFGWVWSPQFQRYCYLSKMAKYPFWGMDYSLWSSKN